MYKNGINFDSQMMIILTITNATKDETKVLKILNIRRYI